MKRIDSFAYLRVICRRNLILTVNFSSVGQRKVFGVRWSENSLTLLHFDWIDNQTFGADVTKYISFIFRIR